MGRKTTQPYQKSKFRRLSARQRRGTAPRVCTPTPILPSPSSTPPVRRRGRPGSAGGADLGPRREGGGADGPPGLETAGGAERAADGGEPVGSVLVSEPGAAAGWERGLPPPPRPERAPGRVPGHRQKDRQPATKKRARSPCIFSLAPEGRSRGSFYPAPRRSAALRVPGPRLRTDGPLDNGPEATARASRAGALRDWASAGAGRLRAEPVTGSRGAALQTDKANGRQTDGGGKDGGAGGGSALLAHPRRVGRVHEPLLSPSHLSKCLKLPLTAYLEE
nr:hapless 2-like [Manis javanica]